MLKRFNYIRNLGIFSDWVWSERDISDFAKYNVIYGWNGSGKTSLTRIFQKLETKKVTGDFKKLKFSLSNDKGEEIREDNFLDINVTVRVFNRLFVERNVDWVNGQTEAIVGIGKEAIDLKEAIERDEKKMSELMSLKKIKSESFKKLDRLLERQIQSAAQNIKFQIGYKFQNGVYNNYNSRPFREVLRTYTDDNNVRLDENQLKNNLLYLDSKEKAQISFDNSYNKFNEEELYRLLSKTAKSQLVEKWTGIEHWIREGRNLHESKEVKDECLFCGNKFENDFWDKLDKHFSEEYKLLRQECEEFKTKVEDANILAFNYGNADLFYSKFQGDYSRLRQEIFKLEVQVNNFLKEIILIIESKVSNLSQINFNLPDFSILKELYKSIDNLLVDYNELIRKNNLITTDFSQEKERVARSLELHFVGEFYIDYKSQILEYEKLKSQLDPGSELEVDISSLDQRIAKNRNEITNYSIQIPIFNNLLERFLGRREIELALNNVDDIVSYKIIRNGSFAKNLSEGEKTALAFVFFLTKLNEAGFNIKESIIVFDDPISSLDSNFLFSAFAFLKEKAREASQIFIFTHNYPFLRLVNRWMNTINSRVEDQNKILAIQNKPLKPSKTSYYMIKNDFDGDGVRYASLVKLDPFLHRYQTEYEYIFQSLSEFINTQPAQIAKYYNVPNLARKCLEIFFSFKYPGHNDLKDKMLSVTDFDRLKIEKIFDFVNFHSHAGSDRAEGVDHSLLFETPTIVKNLFAFLEHIDKEHVERMNDLLAKTNSNR